MSSSPHHTASKKRVGVVRGGPSSEYDVSLKSGGNVLKQLTKFHEKYKTHDILIDKKGHWHMDGVEYTPEQIFKSIDVLVNALHGQYGEDGKLQQLLDRHGVKYTGSGTLASALAMSKPLAKKIAIEHGVKTALFTLVRKGDDTPERAREIFRTFPHPAVVKPVAAGSSVGVSIAYTFADLQKGIAAALEHSDMALIEEYIKGREATAGVIDNFRDQELYSLPPTEIMKPAHSAFFDYDAKYSGASQEICPGNFTHEESAELQSLAKKMHKALGLKHYSRSDFIVSPRRGIYFLEVNTLPGLTDESLFPKSLAAVGVTTADFLDHLINLALEGK